MNQTIPKISSQLSIYFFKSCKAPKLLTVMVFILFLERFPPEMCPINPFAKLEPITSVTSSLPAQFRTVDLSAKLWVLWSNAEFFRLSESSRKAEGTLCFLLLPYTLQDWTVALTMLIDYELFEALPLSFPPNPRTELIPCMKKTLFAHKVEAIQNWCLPVCFLPV